MITTTLVPPRTGTGLPEVGEMPARPSDGDSLRTFVGWAMAAYWVEPADRMPLQLDAAVCQGWAQHTPITAKVVPFPDAFDYDRHLHKPGLRENWAHYSHHLAWGLLGTVATAGACVSVAGDDQQPDPEAEPIPVFNLNGYPLQLPGLMPWDSAALWRYTAAERDVPDGDASTKRRTQALTDHGPGALHTAGLIHDLLTVLLPQQEAPEPAPEPTPRRNRWR